MRKMLGLVALIGVSACVPVNVNIVVNFPEKKLEEALDKRESEIRQEKGTPETPSEKTDKKPSMRERSSTSAVGFVAPQPSRPSRHNVRFQDGKDIDMDVSTPQITEIDKKQTDRFPKLIPYFEKEKLGEGKDASIIIRNEDGLDSKDKAAMRKLVKEENGDRSTLIEEIGRANNIDADHLGKVRKVYVKVLRKHAKSGWWIQEDNGSWKKK